MSYTHDKLHNTVTTVSVTIIFYFSIFDKWTGQNGVNRDTLILKDYEWYLNV